MFSWFVGWLVRVPARRCREYTQPQEFSTVDWEGHHTSPGSGVLIGQTELCSATGGMGSRPLGKNRLYPGKRFYQKREASERAMESNCIPKFLSLAATRRYLPLHASIVAKSLLGLTGDNITQGESVA